MSGSNDTVRVVALNAGKEHFAGGNPGMEANIDRLMEFAEASIPQKPHLICFPEFAITGWPYPKPEKVRCTGESIPGDGCYYRKYVGLARKSESVVCGWMVEKESNEIYHNTSFLVGQDGRFIGKYRKIHLTPGEEGQWWLAPGSKVHVFDLGFARVGIAICWDMSFPEVCRTILLKGGELVLHTTVANDRRDMCPVRCKENSIPMVISVFEESSYAIDHQGRIIADLDGKGGFLVCDIEIRQIRRNRKYELQFLERNMILARRNPEAYKGIEDPKCRIPFSEVFETEEGGKLSIEELLEKFPRLKI